MGQPMDQISPGDAGLTAPAGGVTPTLPPDDAPHRRMPISAHPVWAAAIFEVREALRSLSRRIAEWPASPLVGLWMLVTAYNLFKPFHIDDVAHLEIARWIQGHPLHPMSGQLNWAGSSEPIWRTNQPHLYFAIMALWGTLFGYAEPMMHILQSLASMACVFLLHRIAKFVAPANALWATTLVILGPAFIVEQNMMVDVPLLAVWLAFFALLICGVRDSRQTLRFALAGLACGAAILIKYSSLSLIPILTVALLVERRASQAWTLLIPVGFILAWSALNVLDYGQIHMLTHAHEATPNAYRRVFASISWEVALGALTPLGLIAAVQHRPIWRDRGKLIYAGVGVAFFALAAAVAAGLIPDVASDRVLMAVFVTNVSLIAFALFQHLNKLVRLTDPIGAMDLDRVPILYLGLWLVITTIFYWLISPFIAARHLLLIIPPVTLLLASSFGESLTKASKAFGLGFTLVVSMGLCLSDWRFADFYRSEAVRLSHSLPNKGAIWASGHWGWQWYAEQNGIPQIDVENSPVKPGDLVLVAREVDHQDLPAKYVLRLIRTDTQSNPLQNLICVGRTARFYAFSYRDGPWSLSRDCVNHLDIYRVERVNR